MRWLFNSTTRYIIAFFSCTPDLLFLAGHNITMATTCLLLFAFICGYCAGYGALGDHGKMTERKDAQKPALSAPSIPFPRYGNCIIFCPPALL